MANLSQLVLPVKNTSTGEVTNQTFDLAGGGSTDVGLTVDNNGKICVVYDDGTT